MTFERKSPGFYQVGRVPPPDVVGPAEVGTRERFRGRLAELMARGKISATQAARVYTALGRKAEEWDEASLRRLITDLRAGTSRQGGGS